jgi:DNA-binding IclR family transcriptional regulator
VAVGNRLPLRAPVAPIYVAWAAEPAVDAWLDAADPALSRRARAAAHDDLAAVRRRGWSATIRADDTMREIRDADLRRARLSVVGLSAPVRDDRGTFACSLALTGLTSEPSGAELRALAATLVDAANRAGGLPVS